MNMKMRYAERRVGRHEKERWYWHRKGHPLTRLPDDLVSRFAMVEQLNNRADAVKRGLSLAEVAEYCGVSNSTLKPSAMNPYEAQALKSIREDKLRRAAEAAEKEARRRQIASRPR